MADRIETRKIEARGMVVEITPSRGRTDIDVFLRIQYRSEAQALAKLAKRLAISSAYVQEGATGHAVKKLWEAAEYVEAAPPFRGVVRARYVSTDPLTDEDLTTISVGWRTPLLEALPLLGLLDDRIHDLDRKAENIDARMATAIEGVKIYIRDELSDMEKQPRDTLDEIEDRLDTVGRKADDADGAVRDLECRLDTLHDWITRVEETAKGAAPRDDLADLTALEDSLAALVHDLAERLTAIETRAPWYKRLFRKGQGTSQDHDSWRCE